MAAQSLAFSLRAFAPQDLPQIIALFRGTVRHVNCRDYSPEQLAAWAPAVLDEPRWLATLSAHETVVAERIGQEIVGFGDITPQGYLDRLYVHKDYQRQGIASAILARLEAYAQKQHLLQIETHASITARPFFTAKGFQTIRQQQVERMGQLLTNYVMRKHLA